LLRIANGVVLDESVLNGRVDPIAGNREHLTVSCGVEHIIVEGIRAVKIDRLAIEIGIRVAQASYVVKAGIAVEANWLDRGIRLRIGNAVRELFCQRKSVIGNQVRAGGAEWATYNREAVGDLYVVGLSEAGGTRASAARRRVENFINAVLMVVGREE